MVNHALKGDRAMLGLLFRAIRPGEGEADIDTEAQQAFHQMEALLQAFKNDRQAEDAVEHFELPPSAPPLETPSMPRVSPPKIESPYLRKLSRTQKAALKLPQD